ncbi:Vitamin B12-binding protein [Sporomusa rhizae]|uniref:ABC transporter substrate-binding protein n=1 Tax=Sporomusa rhizae TaxID=357999 RepID=UPI00352A812B
MPYKIKYIINVFILIFCMISCGCMPQQEKPAVGPVNISTAYEVVDDAGNIIQMPEKPQRILTTHFHLDTMLLGIVPPERVVAIAPIAADPGISYMVEEAGQIKYKLDNPSLEAVLMLKPDLIITRDGTSEERIQGYRDLGIKVFISKLPLSIEDMKTSMRSLAVAVGEREAGERVIQQVDANLLEIENTLANLKQEKKRGFLVSQMNSYGGSGCMFDDICTHAGIINAIAEMGIPNGQLVSKELMVKSNPDFFILSANREMLSDNAKEYRKEFLNDPALRHLKAFQNNGVTYIPDRYVFASNQNCVWAIKGIANAAYGDIFNMKNERFIKGY